MKRKFKKKDFPQIRFSFWFFPLFLIILTFLLLYSSWKIEKKREELNLRIEELKRQISILEKENQTLKEKGLEGESLEYLEKILREKGLYKKKGEKVIVVLPPREEKEEKKEKEKGFLEKILEKFNLK